MNKFLFALFLIFLIFYNCSPKKLSEPENENSVQKEEVVPVKIHPKRVFASNILPEGQNYSYEPENAFDDSIETTWATKGFSGREYLQVEFSSKTNIRLFKIYNGFVGVRKYWERNSRAKDISIECDGKTIYKGTLVDTDKEQEVQLTDEITCLQIKFNFLSPYYPKKGDKDLCITDIQIFGKEDKSQKRENIDIPQREESKILTVDFKKNEESIKKAIKELLQKYKSDTEKNLVISIPENILDPKESRQITSSLMKMVMDDGRFKIVERESLGKILKEQALQQTGITDDSEVGKIAGANVNLLVLYTDGFMEFKMIDTKTSQIYSYSSASLK